MNEENVAPDVKEPKTEVKAETAPTTEVEKEESVKSETAPKAEKKSESLSEKK